MNTLHLTSGGLVQVLVPVFSFANGVLVDPTAASITVEFAVRDIDSAVALVYTAGSWELDSNSVWCAKSPQTLAAGRYQYWLRITTPSEVAQYMTGILIVAAA